MYMLQVMRNQSTDYLKHLWPPQPATKPSDFVRHWKSIGLLNMIPEELDNMTKEVEQREKDLGVCTYLARPL